MKITTETYRNTRGKMITRHYMDIDDGNIRVLTTQLLWQLTLNAMIALGKCLETDEEAE